MPNSIRQSFSNTPSKKSNNGSWILVLLATVLAGTAATWFAIQWYAYPENKTWLQKNWHDLKSYLPANKSIVASSQIDTPTNIKAWQQTLRSIDELNKEATTSGNEPSYHNRLGMLYAQIGNFGGALKQFNQAIILCRKQIWDKKNKSKPCDLSNLYVELTCAHSNLARIYDRIGDHDHVIAELEELNSDISFAGRIPSHQPATQNTVALSQVKQTRDSNGLTPEQAALFAKAEALRQVGQAQEAMQAYADLIKQVPNFALAHQRLGLAAIANNNLGLAMNELLTAITLDNKNPDTYNDIGLVYRQLGDYQAAKQAFGQAHNLDPKHLSASMNYADSLAVTGSLASALHVMQQTTKYHPDSPAAHNDLAALYGRTGNDKAAAKEFAQTLNLNSGLASAHYGLGLASFNLKSYPQAINELETAQKLNPGILDLQNRLDLANSSNSKELASAQDIAY